MTRHTVRISYTAPDPEPVQNQFEGIGKDVAGLIAIAAFIVGWGAFLVGVFG